jgi:hypothetical protein
MKPLFIIAAGLCLALQVFSQSPVSWTFTTKKIDKKTYEVHIEAVIASSWKIYSQETPEGGPVPTTFNFTKNPLFLTDGTPKEVGTLKKMHEDVFDVDVMYYKEKVEFIQLVRLKKAAKTKLSGSLQYMACNDTQCLPPATVQFSVAL